MPSGSYFNFAEQIPTASGASNLSDLYYLPSDVSWQRDPVVLTAEGTPGGSATVIFIEQMPIGP